MAQVSGTTDTLDIKGMREDLEDTIWELFPGDTWCLTNFDQVSAKQTYHEWQTDSLAGATANRQVEGDDAAYTTINATTRLGNYQQISRKTFLISATVEAVNKAGRKSEAAYQMMKQMRELKRDMEQALIGNQGSSAGGNTTARSTGSMEAWIASTNNGGNAVNATSTSNASTAAFTAGLVTSPVDGSTTGALTIAKLSEAIQLAWTQGGNITTILAGATQKAAIDAFSSIATRFVDIDRKAQAVITNAANVLVTDFGTHTVVLHRYIRSSVVLCIDPDYWATSFLRRPSHVQLAQTGDGEKHMLITEFGLVARNPLASAKVVACA